jgi:hypothetical protein
MCGLSFGQAIKTTEIAAISNADAKVAEDATVRIDQEIVLGH